MDPGTLAVTAHTAAPSAPTLIEYRSFRNTDLAQLAEVWRVQGAQRGLMQPMSALLFERFVLSKPYFERDGLIVAAADGKLVGFSHAGFGPTADGQSLSRERGVTCLLMTRPEADPSVAAELLARSEAYLRAAGAKELFGGGGLPSSPFYFGLYGGSEFTGVLDSDPRMQQVFHAAGYLPRQIWTVMHRDLATFRPTVDRQQMQIRRHTSFESNVDPPATSWWDACTFEPYERTLCFLAPRERGPAAASVQFWNMETMTGAWGVHAVGLVNLLVSAERQRQGLARFLMGEAFRQLHSQSVAMVEVYVPEENTPAVAVFASLGFEPVDRAVHYVKP